MKLNEIFTFENLYNAHKTCRKSKQHKGEVIRFEINLSTTINELVKDLQSKNYKIGKYKEFMIYDPKERLIEALPYKDRVVLMCFCMQSIAPRIEKSLIMDNVACRKNKGTHFGVKRLAQFLRHEYLTKRDNNIYYLKCDIKKYFPSINHDILIDQLKKRGFSKDEMWLIRKFVKDQPNSTTVGIPLGNQSSQWFALLYLSSLDRLIKEKLKIRGYVRYMDDMILIHRDKKYLQKCRIEIEKYCNRELKLSLNKKTQIGKVSDGIDFLGFRHSLSSSGKVILKLRTTARIRMKRHLKTLSKLESKKIVDSEYVNIRKNAFYAHIKDTNEAYPLKMKLLSSRNITCEDVNKSDKL